MNLALTASMTLEKERKIGEIISNSDVPEIQFRLLNRRRGLYCVLL